MAIAIKQLAVWAGNAKFTVSAMSKVLSGDVALNTLSVDAAMAQLASLTNSPFRATNVGLDAGQDKAAAPGRPSTLEHHQHMC